MLTICDTKEGDLMKKATTIVLSISFSLFGCVTKEPHIYRPISIESFDPVGKYCYENSFLKDYNTNAEFFNSHSCRYTTAELNSKMMEVFFLSYGGHNSFKSYVYFKGQAYACFSAKHNEKNCRQLNAKANEVREKELEKQQKDIFYKSQSRANDDCFNPSLTRMYIVWGQACSFKFSHLDKEIFQIGYFEYARDNKINLDKLFDEAYKSFVSGQANERE